MWLYPDWPPCESACGVEKPITSWRSPGGNYCNLLPPSRPSIVSPSSIHTAINFRPPNNHLKFTAEEPITKEVRELSKMNIGKSRSHSYNINSKKVSFIIPFVTAQKEIPIKINREKEIIVRGGRD